MRKPSDETYSPEEAKRRFEAALRGARIAGHKSMTDMQGGKRKPSRATTSPASHRRAQKKKPAK